MVQQKSLSWQGLGISVVTFRAEPFDARLPGWEFTCGCGSGVVAGGGGCSAGGVGALLRTRDELNLWILEHGLHFLLLLLNQHNQQASLLLEL